MATFYYVISEDANAGWGFSDEDERYTYLLSDQKIGEHVEQSDLFKSAIGIAIPVETSLFFSFDQPGKIPVTTEELSTNKDQWLTESKQHFEDQLVLYPNVYVCGPAVRIKLKGKKMLSGDGCSHIQTELLQLLSISKRQRRR